MHAPFSFTRIVIVQSLEPHERQTGSLLSTFLSGLNDKLDRSVPVQLIARESAIEFRLDSVMQHGRFTDNHFGRSTGMIVGRYPVMVVAPCC